MAITDTKMDEKLNEAMTPQEIKKGLAMTKRIFTDKSLGSVFIFEKTPTSKGHSIEGMNYASHMDKKEALFSVLKVLQLDTDEIIAEVANYLRDDR